MAVMQELNASQIDELILSAIDRKVPALITINRDGCWANLHSRVLAIHGSHLLLEHPPYHPDEVPHEFVPAERIGVSFKLKHHKHVFSATLVGREQFTLEDGSQVHALAVVAPSRMQRLQRRAFLRAPVPENRIVRASFWLGSCACEPAGVSPTAPVWSGYVMNISAGGFQLSCDPAAVDGMEAGDNVGVRLTFDAGSESVYSDAQFRHMELTEGRAMLGFQFIGLTETPEGRISLQMISSKVHDFHRASQKGRGGSHRQN